MAAMLLIICNITVTTSHETIYFTFLEYISVHNRSQCVIHVTNHNYELLTINDPQTAFEQRVEITIIDCVIYLLQAFF